MSATVNASSTDTSVSFTLIQTVAQDFYGGHDFVDMNTPMKDEWLGGIWLVLRTNVAGDTFDGVYTSFGTPDYQYFIWHFDTYLYKETGSSVDNEQFSQVLSLVGSSDFTASQTWSVDVYDLVKLVNGGITSIGQFENGGGVDVTAITTYVNA